MPGAVYLRGDDVALATVEEEDLPFLRDTINDPDVRRYLPHRPPLNLAQETAFFEDAVSAEEDVHLLITADGDPVGIVGLESIDPVNGSAEIGLFLAEDAWGEGYGTEAARLVTGYAFRERRLHRVTADVVEGNEASRRIWEKLGFRHEATFREASFLDGEHVDRHRYAALTGEWLE